MALAMTEPLVASYARADKVAVVWLVVARLMLAMLTMLASAVVASLAGLRVDMLTLAS